MSSAFFGYRYFGVIGELILKKVSVIGLFCTGIDVADGQSIKTRIVAREIEKNIGSQEMQRIDTYGWKKNPF